MANPQLKHKPTSLEIKINPTCKAVPNGALARLSRTQANGESSTVFWYAETDCCISLPLGAFLPNPTGIIQLDAGTYSIIYTLDPHFKGDSIRYNVVCSRPCPQHTADNGESIIIDP
jgi:hypothetical protein